MPNEFKPGDKVQIRHKDALGMALHLEGIIDAKPAKDGHCWVDIGNMRLLIQLGDISHVKATDQSTEQSAQDHA